MLHLLFVFQRSGQQDAILSLGKILRPQSRARLKLKLVWGYNIDNLWSFIVLDDFIHWPTLFIEVLSLDSWERFRTEGYSYLTIPSKAGKPCKS